MTDAVRASARKQSQQSQIVVTGLGNNKKVNTNEDRKDIIIKQTSNHQHKKSNHSNDVFQLPFNTPDRIKANKNESSYPFMTVNVLGMDN